VKTAVDTNVVSAIFSIEASAEAMAGLLQRAAKEGQVVVCGPVYAELLAHPMATADMVDFFLDRSGILIDSDLDTAIWREAGIKFAEYARRRRKSGGGAHRRLLADFVIGAHALLRADRLVTLDPKRYRHDFPKLRLLPRAHLF
jgi:predicted nucleic acid-binding protein